MSGPSAPAYGQPGAPSLPVRLPIQAAPLPVQPAPALHLHEPDAPGRILIRDCIEVTAAHFGVSVDKLLAQDKRQPVAGQRQIAMYLACRLTKKALPFIGLIFDGRDHTTILHGFRRVKAKVDTGDVATVEAVNAIAAHLTGGANM